MASPTGPDQQGAAMILSYTPLPHEAPFYEGLFNLADQRKTGVLAGNDAVGFLSRSQIPLPTLKSLWNMADQTPKTNTLDKRKFFIIVRLIQLFQNSQRPQGSTLAVAEGVQMKPVHFEGVTGVLVHFPSPAGQIQDASSTGSVGSTPILASQPSPPLQPPSSPQQATVANPQANFNSNHSTAITMHQDQYAMFPHEQTRYDALFPNYERLNDGYVYGAEAVTLFSRSGLSKDILREIWNLADNPVDNRLDRVEFAIAMHLIVCVSKKNLEVPPGLPLSLQALKNAGKNQPPSVQPPQTLQAPNSVNPEPPTNAAGAPPPADMQQGGNMQQPPPVTQNPSSVGMTMNIPQPIEVAPSQENSNETVTTGMETTQPAIMSISDAFSDIPVPDLGTGLPAANQLEGNNNMPTLMEEAQPVPPPVQQYQAQQQDVQLQPNQLPVAPTLVQPNPVPPPVSLAQPNPVPVPPSYDESPTSLPSPTEVQMAESQNPTIYEEDISELDKLKKVLQQLQAENVSLKAQLSTVSEEEADVQKEVSATIVEIGVLSKELMSLRNEVSEAKAALIEATSELKSQKEKKSGINEMITSAKETLVTLNGARESIENMSNLSEHQMEMSAPVPVAAAPPAPAQTFDFFGGFEGATQNQNAPLAQQTGEQHHSSADDLQHAIPPENQNQIDQMNAAPAAYNGFQNNQGYMGGAPVDLNNQNMQPMGGVAAPEMTNPIISPDSFGLDQGTKQPVTPPTQEEAARMHQEAIEAADIATKAEQEQQLAMLHAEEMQRAAEKAQAEATEIQTAMSKKKGFGKKKNQKKDYEKALQKASEMKKEALDAQNRITELQVIAMKAKREADQLRAKSEQAEFDIAAAASVQEMQDASRMNGNGMGPGVPMNNGMQSEVPHNNSQGFDNPFSNFDFQSPSTAAGQF